MKLEIILLYVAWFINWIISLICHVQTTFMHMVTSMEVNYYDFIGCRFKYRWRHRICVSLKLYDNLFLV